MVTVILMFYLPFCIGLDVAKILFLCLRLRLWTELGAHLSHMISTFREERFKFGLSFLRKNY